MYIDDIKPLVSTKIVKLNKHSTIYGSKLDGVYSKYFIYVGNKYYQVQKTDKGDVVMWDLQDSIFANPYLYVKNRKKETKESLEKYEAYVREKASSDTNFMLRLLELQDKEIAITPNIENIELSTGAILIKVLEEILRDKDNKILRSNISYNLKQSNSYSVKILETILATMEK
jgi:hypothetical protein